MAAATTDFQFNEAVRRELSLKIILSGSPGSGKTLSSLMLAAGLIGIGEQGSDATWGDIAFADTENDTALYYVQTAHDTSAGLVEIGKFTHIPFPAPYHPARWVKVIADMAAKKKRVGILDCASQEWSGVGGTLDFHRQLGGQVQHWKEASPAHQAFVDAVRYAPLPLIVCLRENVEHVIEKVADGRGGEKTQVRKVGLKPQQREGFEYEVDIQLSLDQISHAATASKDRTGLLAPMPAAPITIETGRVLANWAKSGADPVGSRGWVAKRCQQLRQAATLEQLAEMFATTNKQIAGLLTQEYRDAIAKAKDEAKARLQPKQPA